MQSNSTKAAAGHLKCTRGMFLDKVCKFKTGDDLDDSHSRLESHFEMHSLDMAAHKMKLNAVSITVSVFTTHPKFAIDNIKAQNKDVVHCDVHDKQNNDDVLECLMDSLGEDP